MDLYFEFAYERSIDKSIHEDCLETGLQRKMYNTNSKRRLSLLEL